MIAKDPQAHQDDAAEQAAAWCLRLADGDLTPREQGGFNAWLAADAVNAKAFDDAARAWRVADEVAVTPELIGMRAAALESFRRANRRRWAPRLFTPKFRFAAVAATTIAIVFGAGLWGRYAPQVYRTGVAERRVVVLTDGSKISLDADTQVDVRYLGDRRALRLDHGRAKFTVAKNPNRPFTVATADKVVLATGTEFSVELLRSQIHVILYQGHVAVLDHPVGGGPLQRVILSNSAAVADQSLTPGRELVTPVSARAATVVSTDPSRSLSWEAGQLVFADEPLIAAVERVNRYSTDKVSVGDAAAGQIRISGVFTAGDTAAFVEGITGVFPVEAHRQDGHEILVSKSG